MVASRSLLAALTLAGVLLSAPAGAQVTVYRAPRPPLCGNGYCDAWRGEDARNCPEDCAAPGARLEPKPPEWMRGDPVPPGFHVEMRRSRGLLITGAALFGAFGALSAGFGAAEIRNGGAYAFIPLAGPFISAHAYRDPCHELICLSGAFYEIGQIMFGLGQLTGASLLTAGLIVRHETLVPGTFVPVPILGQDRAGIGLAGAF